MLDMDPMGMGRTGAIFFPTLSRCFRYHRGRSLGIASTNRRHAHRREFQRIANQLCYCMPWNNQGALSSAGYICAPASKLRIEYLEAYNHLSL